MPENPRIRMFIKPSGETRLVFENFEGTECTELGKAFEEAMGADFDTIEYLPEFYQPKRERNVLLRDV